MENPVLFSQWVICLIKMLAAKIMIALLSFKKDEQKAFFIQKNPYSSKTLQI
jgi:hypothetical protein